MPSLHKTIDWDKILESYGEETRIGLHKLLVEGGVSESDPAALVIAALFISQIDANKAFTSLTTTIDRGKHELSEEFKTQIMQLKGIVAYAKEHLVETSKEEVSKRHDELLDVVKAGISQAIGRSQQRLFAQSTASLVSIVAGVSVAALVSMLCGGAGVYWLMSEDTRPVAESPVSWEAVPDAELWLAIAAANEEQLAVCLSNRDELENKCAIALPQRGQNDP